MSKIVNKKDNIQMYVTDAGKLDVCNIITYDIAEEGTEVSDFFGSIDSKEDVKKHFTIVNSKGYVATSKWFGGTDVGVNIDMYPEELQATIKKSINSSFGIAEKLFKERTVKEFNETSLKDSLELAGRALADLEANIKKYKAIGGVDNIGEYLDRYFFRKHLLIQGEKGGGKTYSVHKKLLDEGISYEEYDGHEGTEAIDLLGYYMRNSAGNFVFMDGVLSRAFRKAQTEKTVLFIDEILRIPSRELNILVGALTHMADGTFTLRTGRIVNEEHGIGESEMIKIPKENLWCVATTNVGAGYEVDEIDLALADRFRTINKVTSNTELESILSYHCKKAGLNESSVVPKMLTFYTQMREFVSGGELHKFVNTRHLCEAIELSKDESELPLYLGDFITNWATQNTDGTPDKAESKIIAKLIKKSFS